MDAPAHPTAARRRTRLRQIAGSALLLSATAALVDVPAVIESLRGYRLAWLALGVVISLPQLALCALRWRYTAARLGARLPYGLALSEYYVSSFFNQVLPLGVMGDAMRVARHRGRGPDRPSTGVALHAVVLERAAGQLVLALWALSALPLWLGAGAGVATATAGAGLGAGLWLGQRFEAVAERLPRGRLGRLVSRSGHALLAGRAALVQLGLSSLVLITLVGHYYCAARALGIELSPQVLARITPVAMASMALPISFGGWGIREAANAALFAATGLGAAAGAAVGVSYGLITLAGSAPALVILLGVRR